MTMEDLAIPIRQNQKIQTERLVLKSYSEQDAEALVQLLTNEEVTKTFMVPDFTSEDQVWKLAEKLIAFSRVEDTGHLEYGIYFADTLIGFINDCGVENDTIEVGYVIHPAYKGRGFATEAVTAVIQDLFRMGFGKVKAGYFRENTASRRVMEKCGMAKTAQQDTEEYRGVRHVCEYYEIKNPVG